MLAAAIKCKADVLITFNKKDFPSRHVFVHNILVETPDEFACRLLKANLPKVFQALLNQVNALKNPRQNTEQVLDTLENCGLSATTAILKEALATYTLNSFNM